MLISPWAILFIFDSVTDRIAPSNLWCNWIRDLALLWTNFVLIGVKHGLVKRWLLLDCSCDTTVHPTPFSHSSHRLCPLQIVTILYSADTIEPSTKIAFLYKRAMHSFQRSHYQTTTIGKPRLSRWGLSGVVLIVWTWHIEGWMLCHIISCCCL